MKRKNRVESVDVRPKGALFSQAGQTGRKRIRNIHDHKEGKLEGDFHHLHAKFYDPESDGPIDE
jgi:hypothetical protein